VTCCRFGIGSAMRGWSSINNVSGKYMENRISFLTSKWLESASEYSMLWSSTRYNRVSDEPRGHSHARSVVCDR